MLLVVGRIGRPHGIRGEVTVEVRTDEPEQRFAAGAVLVTDPAAARAEVDVPPTLAIETVRWHQGRPLVLFDGIYERDLAENLRDVLAGPATGVAAAALAACAGQVVLMVAAGCTSQRAIDDSLKRLGERDNLYAVFARHAPAAGVGVRGISP